jgi:hypothetical protein
MKNGLKEVKYEKYKSISILYLSKTLIIRGSQDHALVGPHNTAKGFSNNTAGTLFVCGKSFIN